MNDSIHLRLCRVNPLLTYACGYDILYPVIFSFWQRTERRYMVDNGFVSVLMAFVFLLILVSVSGCVAVFFRRKWEESIAPVIFSVILTVYFSGLLFDDLSVGVLFVKAVAVLSAAALLFLLYEARRNKETMDKIRQSVRQYCMTPGLICWLIMFVIIYVVYCNKIIAGWDEFSHWGLVVKNMFVFDKFGNYAESTTSFRDYPPGTALWQYFTAKVFSRNLGENHIYHAMGWLIISLQASFLRFFSFDTANSPFSVRSGAQEGIVRRAGNVARQIFSHKKMREAFFAMLLIMFVPLLFTQYIFIYFNSIYVDIILGILFAYILASGFSEERFDAFFYISVFLSVSVLCLIKAIGVFLAVAALLIIAGYKLTEIRQTGLRQSLLPVSLLTLSGITGLLIGKVSWSVYLKLTHTPKAWNTKPLTLSNILALAKGKGQAYQYLTVKNYFKAIFEWPIGIFGTYIGWLTILAVSLIILRRKRRNRENAKKATFYLSGCFVFAVIYAIGLLALYMFTFTESDAVSTAAFNRYLSTVFVGTFVFLAFCLMTFFWGAVSRLKRPIAVLCAVFFVFGLSRQYMRYNKEEKVRIAFLSVWDSAAKNLDFDYKKDNIYFICQNSDGQEYWFFRYAITPVNTNSGGAGDSSPWSIGTPYNAGDAWTKDISCAEWQSILNDGKYNYVFLYRVDDQFREQFADAFENPDEIGSQRIYKAQTENGVSMLSLVN